MKRILPALLALGILAAFAWTLLFLYRKSQAKPVIYQTEQPATSDIVQKTVATGAIVPRKEVEIKPRVSGVIRKLAVQPGDPVAEGDLIAEIQIIPDMLTLNRAQAAVQTAKIAMDSAKRELDRREDMLAQKVVSSAEVDQFRTQYATERQHYLEAVSNLQLVKEGATRGGAKVSNTQVRSTVAGTVLAVPVKEGESVIESNTFNAGTTMATVADMSDMIFQGKVDESEVGKIKVGLDLDIRVGAIDKQTFKGKLEYISPKGVMEEGAIQFEIKARLILDDVAKDVPIRAG
ncbi:MAG TPA: efflux RND transporter periplasmic adaptor subunit, partial [Kofleriaceae bacterium]|nr:efflux RND transporter periplasmic adaptor subunit [Kofleriaceae bacterium]